MAKVYDEIPEASDLVKDINKSILDECLTIALCYKYEHPKNSRHLVRHDLTLKKERYSNECRSRNYV